MKRLISIALALFLTLWVISPTFAVTTDKISYGTSASVTCTLNSLASDQYKGRSALAVDNTSTLADDYLTTVTIISGAGAQANDKAVYVYVSGSEDGTNYEQEESNSPSTDKSYTINSPTIFRGPIVLPVASPTQVYSRVFSIANMFGGVVPRKFSYVIVNYTGQTLNATGNVITITPITYTNS